LCGPKPRRPSPRKCTRRVDAKGRPVRLLISLGNTHDVDTAEALLDGLEPRRVVIADKGYDADRVRSCIRDQGAIPRSGPTGRRSSAGRRPSIASAIMSSSFFNKLKQFRRIATRYDKLGAIFLAFIQLGAIRISLRSIESTP
jgi:transposase